jgi:simple sugar transport system substrate-binding protein
MLAGEVIVRIGAMLANGQSPKDGMDIPGLGKVSVDPKARSIMGSKLQAINKSTITQLVELGL